MREFQGKFERIAEQTLNRYQQGGFLTGDYVHIKKDALSHDSVKKMSDQMQAMIKAAIEQESTLRVSYIKSGKSEAVDGPVDASNIATNKPFADVVFEYAPGMWKDPMTLPLCILDKVDISDMEGYPQYSDDIKRDENLSNDESDEVEQTEGKDVQRNLATKNTKLANTKTPVDGRSTTKLSEGAESRRMLRENDSIFETYVNHLD